MGLRKCCSSIGCSGPLLARAVGGIRIVLGAVDIGDDAAGFADEHRRSGHVPDVIVESIKTVDAARGNVRHVQGRRAGAAQRLGPERKVRATIPACLRGRPGWAETGRQQGFFESWDRLV